NRAVEDFTEYLRGLIARRRNHPNDDPSDILGALIETLDRDEKITEYELLQNCIFLLNAGHETTTNLIGNGIAALLDHPAEMQRLREDPGLIKSAVEEFLRFESSNQIGNRVTAEAVTVGGVDLPAGTQVALSIGGANRDPAQFPDPDQLDIGRTPNRHLAFAAGIHACAGLTLARMEGQSAIGRLVARFPNLCQDGNAVRGGRARFRGYASYPITL
ncbi:MAG: cytochrome P450, partial [Rhodospirillales bacterium]|nr:cytochrome P450 [Rhodospirillales bacterium]